MNPLAEYQARLAQIQVDFDHARAGQSAGAGFLIVALALIGLFFFGASRRRVPLWSVVLPIPAAVAAGRWYGASRRRWLRAHRLRDCYERGSARIEDHWLGQGFAGEEFRDHHHVYDSDLQILGTGSLYELVCTARTGIGRRRLAEYLLTPCDLGETRERQASVRELKPLTGLREQVALLGRYAFEESHWETFAEWIAIPAATAAPWVRAAALASSIVVGSL